MIIFELPHTKNHMYDAWAEMNLGVDAPGATPADLRSLGHAICAEPTVPLDADVTSAPRAAVHGL